MAAASVAFLTWAAVAASAVFWGLRLFVPGAPTPEAAIAASRAPALASADLGRVLGGGGAARPGTGRTPPTAAPADSRFKLLGVMALKDGSGTSGSLALLSIDGKPARNFRVGSVIEGDWVVQQVDARAVTLGPRGGTPALMLSLPPPPVAARITPSPAGPSPAASPSAGGATAPGTGSVPPPTTAAEQENSGEGRVPGPEPGSLRRPGPLNR